MDPKLLYWTLALVNFAVVAGCLFAGVRRIRRRDVAGHRRVMIAASVLVALFLISYLLKLVLLGEEDRCQWSALDHAVLYLHEFCIAAMLAGGASAGFRAWRFGDQLASAPRLALAGEPLRGRRAHRRSGWIAILGCIFALVTAAYVLAGMYVRAAA